jgi:hypothetical protein
VTCWYCRSNARELTRGGWKTLTEGGVECWLGVGRCLVRKSRGTADVRPRRLSEGSIQHWTSTKEEGVKVLFGNYEQTGRR